MTDPNKIDPRGHEKAQAEARPLRDKADALRRYIDEANCLIRDLTVMGAHVEVDYHTFETIDSRPRPVIVATVMVEVK